MHEPLSITSWPAELKLLIDLTRDKNDQAVAKALSAKNLHDGINYQKLIELAIHHRVECLVALNLSANKQANIPTAVRDHFSKRLKHHSLYSLTIARATIEVAGALTKAQIPNVLLKSHAVSQRFYSSANARQCIDIDILVSKHDIARAQSIVEGLGFKQYFPDFTVPPGCEDVFQILACDIAYRRPGDGAQLELHWRLNRNPHTLNWDFDTVLGLSTNMPLVANDIMVLEPVAQMIYLVGHGTKHAWFRLKWLADIYRIVGVLTNEQKTELKHLSKRHGTTRMLTTSLELVKRVYGIPVPSVSDTQPKPRLARNLVNHMLKSIATQTKHDDNKLADFGNLFRYHRYIFNLRPELAYKRSAALMILADLRDIKTLRLSKRWLWLYALAGPLLGAIRIGKRELKARWPSR